MKKAVLLSVLVLLLTSFSFAVTLGLSVSTLNNPFFCGFSKWSQR